MIGVTWEVAHLRFDQTHDLAALIRLGCEWQRQHGKEGPPGEGDSALGLNHRGLLRCTGRARADWAKNCLTRLCELGLISYSYAGVDDAPGTTQVELLPDGVDLLCWCADPAEPPFQA